MDAWILFYSIFIVCHRTFNDSSQKKLFNVPRRGSTQSGVINSPLAGVADQGVVYPGLRTCPLGRPLQAPDQNQAFH
ncbi:hypothetical protein K5549_002456 [Capra hircus]|nr:hypothetical protein K5549_002456 [Capra hircus]